METIKKKINALKEDNEIKQEEIERLQVLHKKEQDEREKVEQELLLMENKVKLLEDNLDRSGEQLAKTTQQLNAAETEKDETDRAMQSLSITEANASDKLADFEGQLKEAKAIAEESDRL